MLVRARYRCIPVILAVAAVGLSAFAAIAAEYHSSLGYSIDLPTGWAVQQEADSRDIFYDETGSAKSYLSVVRHRWAGGDWANDRAWTRSRLISYLITVRHGRNPWGAVVWYDSSSSAVLGDLWAPEAYSRFYSADPVTKAWAEYIIFASRNQAGYEIYAIGDTTDMDTNIGTYAGILRTVTVDQNNNRITVLPHTSRPAGRAGETFRLDLLGRLLPRPRAARRRAGAAGITLTVRPGDGDRARRVERTLRIEP